MFDKCVSITLKEIPDSLISGYLIMGAISDCKNVCYESDWELAREYNMSIDKVHDIIDMTFNKAIKKHLN